MGANLSQAPEVACSHTVVLGSNVISACSKVQEWIEARDCAGYEPYDLLNSPYLEGRWARRKLVGTAIIQSGKRFAGGRIRRWLRVPASKNPKALGLLLAAY